MSFLFRPQRGGLSEAMAECVELADAAALYEHLAPLVVVSVEPYPGPKPAHDARIGWDTYIVMALYSDGTIGPCGFTNAAVECGKTPIQQAKDLQRAVNVLASNHMESTITSPKA